MAPDRETNRLISRCFPLAIDHPSSNCALTAVIEIESLGELLGLSNFTLIWFKLFGK
jgi:hypothetical protein